MSNLDTSYLSTRVDIVRTYAILYTKEMIVWQSINIRIDDNLKKDAENLFNDLGLNMTTATTMFLKQCLYCHGLPFEVRMDPFYSATNQAHLRRAIADLDAGNGKAHELIEVEDE